MTPIPASPATPPGTATGSVTNPDSESATDPGSDTALPSHPLKHDPQRIPGWLERAELFLRVLLRLYIGLALCYAPWSGDVLTFLPWSHGLWDRNPLFLYFPTLGAFAANGAVRGIISGLGLLNLWIAFRDAVRHRDG